MRIGLIIEQFDSIFTTSFKHCAGAKYDVYFDNSNVQDVLTKLQTLKVKVENNETKHVHSGYNITLQDVQDIQESLSTMLVEWKCLTNTQPPKKVYTLLEKLRQAIKEDEQKTSIKTLSKEVLKEVLTPTKRPSKKQQFAEQVESKRKELLVNYMQKSKRIN